MLERGRVSCTQTAFMLINLVGATAVIFLPGITAVAAGRDAWLVPLLSTLPGIYVALVVYSLGIRFPGRTIMEYLQVVLGTWAGRLVGLLYILFFLHTNGVIIREFGELLVTLILPRTPLPVIHAVILLLCAWTVRGGLEIQARLLELTIPFVLVLFMVLILLAAGEMEIKNLAPFLENGLKPVIKGSIDSVVWRGEIILWAMFFPYMVRPGQGRRCAIISVVVIGLILTFDSIANTAMFGPAVARLTFPTFSLVKQVNIADFIERIESVLVVIWVIGMFGKIALFYYAAVLGAAQLASLRDYRPLVLPVGLLLALISLETWGSSVELVDYIVRGYPPFAFIFEYIIPTVLLTVAAARGIKAR